jgi:sigma-E factor negative regulatory protein RseC
MIEEIATITAIKNSTVTVTSQIKSGCSGCAQVDTCGSGQIAKAIPQRRLTLNLPYPNNLTSGSLKVGESIILGLPQSGVLASAGQVYLLPLAGLITFSALGQWLVTQHWLNHELFAFAFGLVGAYLGYRLAKSRQEQNKCTLTLQPQILRTLATSNQVVQDKTVAQKSAIKIQTRN